MDWEDQTSRESGSMLRRAVEVDEPSEELENHKFFKSWVPHGGRVVTYLDPSASRIDKETVHSSNVS